MPRFMPWLFTLQESPCRINMRNFFLQSKTLREDAQLAGEEVCLSGTARARRVRKRTLFYAEAMICTGLYFVKLKSRKQKLFPGINTTPKIIFYDIFISSKLLYNKSSLPPCLPITGQTIRKQASLY